MTSSAASETDSARKRVVGRLRSPSRRMTSRPPPSGMWTSSRTTSGARARDQRDRLGDRRRVADDVDEPVELGAHAGAEQLVVVDEHDPRRGHGVMPPRARARARPRCRRRGAAWIAARPPWRSMRPTIDSRTPRRSAGHRGGIEARAAVADEDLQRAPRRPRRRPPTGRAAGELRGVEHRLAGGGDERLAVAVERRVADRDDVDRARRAPPRSPRGRLQRGGQPALAVRRRGRARRATRAARAPGGARARRPRAGRRRASARARASAGPSRAGARRPRRAPASGCARRARPTASAPAARTTARR